MLHTGGNSGYQLINLVVLRGVVRILLLGYDMKNGPNGEAHWHEDHVHGNNPTVGQFLDWLDNYRTLPTDLAKAGVTVINCSRDTALDCFPRAKLEDVL